MVAGCLYWSAQDHNGVRGPYWCGGTILVCLGLSWCEGVVLAGGLYWSAWGSVLV